jgi:hypothetical protein
MPRRSLEEAEAWRVVVRRSHGEARLGEAKSK